MEENNKKIKNIIEEHEYIEKLIMGKNRLVFDDYGIFFHRDGHDKIVDIQVKWEEMREVSLKGYVRGTQAKGSVLVVEINTLLDIATKKQKKSSSSSTIMWDIYVRYEIGILRFEQDWKSVISDLRPMLDQKGVKHRNISEEELEVFIQTGQEIDQYDSKIKYIVVTIVFLIFLYDKVIS